MTLLIFFWLWASTAIYQDDVDDSSIANTNYDSRDEEHNEGDNGKIYLK